MEEIIRPEDLALEIHRAIYQAALALRRAGRQIDPVLIRTEAARMGAELDGAYLLELMDRTPTAANVKEYAKITRTEARRRELGAMLQRAQTAAAKEEPEEVLSTLAREAAELQQEGTTDELIRPEEALLAFYAHRDAVDQGGSRAVVSTGYLDLDSALGGGMVANGLYILAARPGMGKNHPGPEYCGPGGGARWAGAVRLPGDGRGAAGGQTGVPAVRGGVKPGTYATAYPEGILESLRSGG